MNKSLIGGNSRNRTRALRRVGRAGAGTTRRAALGRSLKKYGFLKSKSSNTNRFVLSKVQKLVDSGFNQIRNVEN